MDGVIGFSLNSATNFTSLAAIVRFSSTGAIDARNGGDYSANVAVPYTAGSSYHFRLVINPAAEHYNAYVTPPGQAEIALATNFAFRSEQSSTSSLNNWSMFPSNGAVSVCNMTIGPNAGPPVITTQPANQTVVAGQAASFSIGATGAAPINYQWRKNGVTISGAVSSFYTTPATTTADSGAQFSVAVSNSSGSIVSNTAKLTVNSAAVALAIVAQPVSQTVAAGQTAVFSVSATGTAPLSYQWRKNGANINGAISSSYTTPVTTTADSGAQFSVVVNNSTGSVTSSAAVLTVNSSTACPCTIWPSSALPAVVDDGPDSPVELGVRFRSDTSGYVTGIRFYKSVANTGVHLGNLWSGTGVLLATATFSGESTSGWQQVNFSSPVAITANSMYVASYHASAGHYSVTENYFTTSGADNAPLHAPANGSSGVNGAYAYGSSSSYPTSTYLSSNYWVDVVFNPTVNILPAPPTVATQPAGQTAIAGQTATFSVVATGSAPLTYQWSRNGANIGGATSASYTTPATTTADNGAKFSVAVSNSAGRVTSGSAALTVNAATRLLSAAPSSLSFGNVNVLASSLLTSTLTNSGNSNVTVSNVSIAGAGLSVSGAFVGQVILPGQTVILNVTLAPAITGSVTGSVTVASNASNSPATVSLSGLGIQLVTHSATLSWTASSSPGVVGYNVYSATVSGGPYSKLTTTPVAATTYKDGSVQSGKTYFYVITAVNSSAESVFSNQASATIP